LRASIVIAILNSHEIFSRQLLHFERMDLPSDVEFVFVDDGSDPPISLNGSTLKNVTMFATNDFRPWTQPVARNKGAGIAQGEYLICTDIDHIISRELIQTVYDSTYDVIRFKRELGVLHPNGDFTQSMDELLKWGYKPREPGAIRIGAHGNSYAIKRELFFRFGGSQQRLSYPNRDEQKIKRWTHRLGDEIKRIPDDDRPTIYMFPNGRFCGDKDFNPFGYFHNLSRKTDGT
jgi:hypothetical protein